MENVAWDEGAEGNASVPKEVFHAGAVVSVPNLAARGRAVNGVKTGVCTWGLESVASSAFFAWSSSAGGSVALSGLRVLCETKLMLSRSKPPAYPKTSCSSSTSMRSSLMTLLLLLVLEPARLRFEYRLAGKNDPFEVSVISLLDEKPE